MSDRPRATVFGEVAEQYERARPSYPDALFAFVVELAGPGPGRVIEIGAGTGKVTRALAPSVAELVAVEPDPAMAAVLRRVTAPWPSVRIVPERFEAWDAPAAAADLVTAGQSWHWVDASVAIPKVVAALRPGGHLAPFWNRPLRTADPLRAAIDDAYARCAPELVGGGMPEADSARADRDTVDPYLDVLRTSGAFPTITTRTYEWSETRTTAEYIELLGTHSNHLLLDPDRRAALYDAIATVVDGAGSTLTVPHRAHLIVARTPG